MKHLITVLIAAAISTQAASAKPPFDGTIFLDPDIITADDPTTYLRVTHKGRAVRNMFDRRTGVFADLKPHIFIARYRDSRDIEVQVNPEFGGRTKAMKLAEKYAKEIGRLPVCLRADVDTVWIHDGVQPFGGGNRNLLIHVGQSKIYEQDGILEETLVHEASHTSLDEDHARAPGWIRAQGKDDEFISTYARQFPKREDVAETFLLYLAIRYRRDRISDELATTILETIPARIRYFDRKNLVVTPVN